MVTVVVTVVVTEAVTEDMVVTAATEVTVVTAVATEVTGAEAHTYFATAYSELQSAGYVDGLNRINSFAFRIPRAVWRTCTFFHFSPFQVTECVMLD